jgi:hypothetical protein
VLAPYRALASRRGIARSDTFWFDQWVAQVRADHGGWLLCGSCRFELEAHLAKPAVATPSRRSDLFHR